MTAIAEVTTEVTFPAKLKRLFEPFRYKTLWGGRGASKSWAVARALLVEGSRSKLRMLCTREIQKSIKDSVHKLLSDQITALDLGDFYTVLETTIRGQNGTEFIFAGLQDHTVDSIKSFEGVDRVWVEEAHAVSKKSWDILIPTIRKDGSEIWITFNPQLETDETYVRFVEKAPPGSFVVHLTYRDNPWFPPVLELELQHAEKTMNPEDYRNIWGGQCRTAVEGAIYGTEMVAMAMEGRLCVIPYDPRMKVHTVWDFGWNDLMVVGLVQRGAFEARLIDYYEFQFKRVDEVAGFLSAKPLNWGDDYLPHDGYTGDCKSGKTVAQILKAFGRRPKPVNAKTPAQPMSTVEVGIKNTRLLFPRLWIDKTIRSVEATSLFTAAGGGSLVERLKRYKRHVPKHGEPAEPVHDENSHGADMLRGLSFVVDRLTNEDEARPRMHKFEPSDAAMGVLG